MGAGRDGETVRATVQAREKPISREQHLQQRHCRGHWDATGRVGWERGGTG